MSIPSTERVLVLVVDTAGAIAVELALTELAHRLTEGPTTPLGRRVGRTLGSVVLEVVASGAAPGLWRQIRSIPLWTRPAAGAGRTGISSV